MTQRRRWALYALVGAAIFWRYAAAPLDWEVLVSKHYWSSGFYYGGYSLRVLPVKSGFRTIHLESQANLENIEPLTTPTMPPWRVQVGGFPGTERLLAPLFAYMFLRGTVSQIDIGVAFYLLNLASWIVSIILVYQLAAHFYNDTWTPACAALFCAMYPPFTLTLLSLKAQPLGTAYMLACIWVFELHLRRSGVLVRFIGLLSMMWVGLFASGGWIFVALYVALRQFWLIGYERWVNLLLLGLSVALARRGFAALVLDYRLPTVEAYTHVTYGGIVQDTITWLTTWWRGGDITKLKLFNIEGEAFYRVFLPTIGEAFIRGHAFLLAGAALGCLLVPRARMWALMAVPLFFAGHAGTALTGWAGWHYGYLSAPAGIFLMLAAAPVVGQWLARPDWRLRGVAAALVIVTLWGFTDLKTHASLYWGGNEKTYTAKVRVYYQGDAKPVTY